MLALIGNLDALELGVILIVAIMVFGKRLPEVTMRGAAHLMKLRREVSRMWREAGLEEELRRVRRDIEQDVPRRLPTPERLMRDAEREAEEARRRKGTTEAEAGPVEPLDPLARESLDEEPEGPGEEDVVADPTAVARREPDSDEPDDADRSNDPDGGEWEHGGEPEEGGDRQEEAGSAEPPERGRAGPGGTEKESA